METKQLKDMTPEELKEQLKARVTFRYMRKKTEDVIEASVQLGPHLEIPLKKITKDDIALLCQEEGLEKMPNNITLIKPIRLTRGKPATGPAVVKGRDYFRVEVAIAPGVVLKAFLNEKQRLYVTNDYELERRFITIDPKIPKVEEAYS